jgi:methylase of polypeptide subunit release factors
MIILSMIRSLLHLAQRRLTQEEARKFQQMLQRLFHREPIQYVIGEHPAHR